MGTRAVPTRPGAKLLTRATHYAPYIASAHVQLASLDYTAASKAGQGAQSSTDVSNAMTQAKTAVRYAHWDPTIEEQAAALAYQLGDANDAYTWAERAVIDDRFDVSYLNTFMAVAVWNGITQYPQNPSSAKQDLSAAVNTYLQMQRSQKTLSAIPSNVTGQWASNVQQYKISPMTQLYTAIADYGLAKYQASMELIKKIPVKSVDWSTNGLSQIVAQLDKDRLSGASTADVMKHVSIQSPTLTSEYQQLVKVGK